MTGLFPTVQALLVDVNGNPIAQDGEGTPVAASSGIIANGIAVATLPGVAGKTTYITGAYIFATGETATGQIITPTIVGLVGGTMTFIMSIPVGVLLTAQPILLAFAQPIPATAVNTQVQVVCPAVGAGGSGACVATGFQL